MASVGERQDIAVEHDEICGLADLERAGQVSQVQHLGPVHRIGIDHVAQRNTLFRVQGGQAGIRAHHRTGHVDEGARITGLDRSIGAGHEDTAGGLDRTYRIGIGFVITSLLMQRLVAVAGHLLKERNHGEIVAGLGVHPGVGERRIEVIVTKADHVGGIDELQVREPVVGSRHPVRSAGRLDRIDGGAHGSVANRMDVKIESCGMNPPRILQDHLPRMLQLTVGNGALRGMIAVRLHKELDRVGRVVFLRLRPYARTQRRCCVDVARHRGVAVSVAAEDGLQEGP